MALACCVVSWINLAGSLQSAGAMSEKVGKQLPVQRVQPALPTYSSSQVVQNSKRTRVKSSLKRPVRASDKKRNKPHRTKCDRKGTSLASCGMVPSGAGREIHDLSYHGILVQPQRYDPLRGPRKTRGVVLSPEARDLQVEHFQELDRNLDGVLDPLERAVGRLDIERDMNNR